MVSSIKPSVTQLNIIPPDLRLWLFIIQKQFLFTRLALKFSAVPIVKLYG